MFLNRERKSKKDRQGNKVKDRERLRSQINML